MFANNGIYKLFVLKRSALNEVLGVMKYLRILFSVLPVNYLI